MAQNADSCQSAWGCESVCFTENCTLQSVWMMPWREGAWICAVVWGLVSLMSVMGSSSLYTVTKVLNRNGTFGILIQMNRSEGQAWVWYNINSAFSLSACAKLCTLMCFWSDLIFWFGAKFLLFLFDISLIHLLYLSLSPCVSLCVSVSVFLSLSVYLSLSLSICFCLSLSLCVCVYVCLCLSLSVSLSCCVCLYVCLSVSRQPPISVWQPKSFHAWLKRAVNGSNSNWVGWYKRRSRTGICG